MNVRRLIQSVIDSPLLRPVWAVGYGVVDWLWLGNGGAYRRIDSEKYTNRHPWLEIEVTNVCTANCSFCAYGQQTRKKTVMGRAMYEKVIDEYAASGGGKLVLTPFVGESLADKEFVGKLAYAKSKGNIGPISFSTNATLLTDLKFEELVEAGLDAIEISCSGFDREEYKRVYRVDKFETVFANLCAVAESPYFKDVENVINVRTDRLFPKFTANWKRLVKSGWNMRRGWFYDNWGGAIKPDALTGCMFIKPKRPIRHQPCAYMYGGVRVSATGEISACGCRNFNADGDLIVGHVKNGLNSPLIDGAMERVRNRFLSGKESDLPNTCRQCREWRPSK